MTTRHRKAHDKLLHNNDNINNNINNNNNQTVGLQSQTPENCHIDGRLVVTSQAPAGQGVGISKAPRTSRAAYLVGALLLCWPPAVQAHKVLAHHLLPYLEDSPPTIQVAVELCNVFKVVEKPYYILFASCWVCAVLQQIIDTTRYFEERNEELGLIQKCYVGSQLLALVLETATLWSDIDWNGANLWDMYNLYVYIFVHSSVFVRSVMMSMIVWDWLTAELLKRPVFGAAWDGQGWRDYHRALLLIIILQFGSSAFIMVLIMVTHVIPGMTATTATTAAKTTTTTTARHPRHDPVLPGLSAGRRVHHQDARLSDAGGHRPRKPLRTWAGYGHQLFRRRRLFPGHDHLDDPSLFGKSAAAQLLHALERRLCLSQARSLV
ncbi:unnamed protein product [Polarella glacialis]|uniref:Uncharacterized protein n=1 Tax=Polarella glacialis TaxID=89957 RepID=A0A813E9U6_POLGL|nr:unnamed protein product [Polarella glacialis]